MTGAIAKAEELKNEIEGSMIAGQFVNPANPDAHRRTTGPEIWNDTDGEAVSYTHLDVYKRQRIWRTS